MHVRAQYFRRAVNKLRRYFFKRIVAHGNAGHLAAVAVKHCAKHQSRKRSAAARGCNYVVYLYVLLKSLGKDFARAVNVAHRSKRHAAATRHKLRIMPRRAQLVRNAVHFLIYVVVAVRIDKAHLRAQQLVYKQIAYPSLHAALL